MGPSRGTMKDRRPLRDGRRTRNARRDPERIGHPNLIHPPQPGFFRAAQHPQAGCPREPVPITPQFRIVESDSM